MNNKTRLSILLAAAFGAGAATACTAVIVGKKASATGRVIVAHNEDNSGDVFIRHALVPARDFAAGEKIRQEPDCAAIDQVPHAFGYFWSEVKSRSENPPAGDMMLNENGVIVFSNNGGWQPEWNGAKGSLPDEGVHSTLTEGGLKHTLRRAVAERARTAREGVAIMTNLVSRWGYAQASRIFTIADKDEAWVVEVIKGRRFVARRCPDDAVVVHPNCLSVTTLRPDDVVSPNIAAKGADFDFTQAYQGPRRWCDLYNCYRWKFLYKATTGVDLPLTAFPFSVKPTRPVTEEMIRAGLSSHYEGTDVEVKDRHPVDTQTSVVPLCRRTTVESFVCTFGETPKETSLSLATGRPCETPYASYRPFAGVVPSDTAHGDLAVKRLDTHDLPLAKCLSGK